MGGLLYWDTGTPVVRLNEKRDVTRWTVVEGAIMDLDPGQENKEETMAKAAAAAVAKEAEAASGGPSPKTASLVPGASDVKKVTKVKKEKAPVELHPCKCGCGEQVAGKFRMGHDSRYYSILKKVVGGKMKFSEMSELMRKEAKNIAGVQAILAASNH
jgi:hypothetical protein